MAFAPETIKLLKAARELVKKIPADAVLILADGPMEWDKVLEELSGTRILVAARHEDDFVRIKDHPDLTLIEIESGPTPTQERMSLALLEAVRSEKLKQGAEVVVLYNGIEVGEEKPDMIDTLSLIKLGEHLEKLSAQDLRRLDTQVPLETLRAVVDLATEIGREGREGHPVGTMFVVGDTRKVMALSRPMNFNPFRGYSDEERDVRNLAVREQIKDIAKLEGAIIIRRDGVAVAAARRIEASYSGFTLSMGLGTRHASAAAISKSTKAIAVTVSQSSGTVRVFQNGDVMLHIEPFARPMTWGKFKMDALEDKKS